MPWIEVHAASPANEAALATLDAAAWPQQLRARPRPGADQPFFSPTRRPHDVLVAVEEPDGVILGHIDLAHQFPIPSNAHVMRLEQLFVSPAARNSGLGARLLVAAVEEARIRGARKLEVRALATNDTAIDLYTRHGFVEEARFRDEFVLADGRYVDDVWFARWLG